MKKITPKQYRFFKHAWDDSLTLDQAKEKASLKPYTLRRWFAEDRFLTYCKNFIHWYKTLLALREVKRRGVAMKKVDDLLEHPAKIASEHHWKFILAAAAPRDTARTIKPRPSRKGASLTCQEMLEAKPLRTDKQELLEEIKQRKLAAQKQTAA